MDQEKIGKVIKDLRKRNNMTQQDLASKLGVTYQAVSKWENGKNIPDIAILKDISRMFDIDLNYLLDGEMSKKTKINTIIFLVSLVLIFICSFIYINRDTEFNVKEIKSTCKNYAINGVVAYTKSKSSIIITNIDYCGLKDSTEYDSISCNLYEQLNNKTTKIMSCKKKKNIKIDDYLKNIKINVDNYKSMCNKFSKAKLYLEIETKNKNGVNTHKIPLKLESECD